LLRPVLRKTICPLKHTLRTFAKSDEGNPLRAFMRILLASASTRRGLILKERYSDVVQRPLGNVDENVPRGPVSEQVREVSLRKSRAVLFPVDEDVVVVSDTLVEDPDDENAALGQPRDVSHATSMLIRLRGRRHRVWSATSIYALEQWDTTTESAIVEFSDFSDNALIELIESNSWKGKAGGYDLAGLMGEYASLVEGSESTVLGFTEKSLEYLDQLRQLL
jgi:septum formation protein